MKTLLPIGLIALLAACSSQKESAAPAPEANASTAAAAATEPPPTSRSTTATGGKVLALEGLGDLVIGKPIPAGSSFTSGGEGMPGSDCATRTSVAYPGVYALTEGGAIRRITVGKGSDVKLAEGIGTGSTEAEVLAAFPGFESEPHKYVGGKAKYLTQPGTDPRLRFEIGEDGKVTDIHVGEMPQLGYVEGCA
jgi:hypothetical protein